MIDFEMQKTVTLIFFFFFIATLGCKQDQPRFEQDLSDFTWSIWIDSSATWQTDSLYMPPVDLRTLSTNTPGNGWDHLEDPELPKTKLPATVEQYFWDNRVDTAWGAGDYKGVSWFTTTLDIPDHLEGKTNFP